MDIAIATRKAGNAYIACDFRAGAGIDRPSAPKVIRTASVMSRIVFNHSSSGGSR